MPLDKQGSMAAPARAGDERLCPCPARISRIPGRIGIACGTLRGLAGRDKARHCLAPDRVDGFPL